VFGLLLSDRMGVGSEQVRTFGHSQINSMFRLVLLAILVAILAVPAFAQSLRYSEAQLTIPPDGDLSGRLAAHGLQLGHARIEDGRVQVILSEDELAVVLEAGIEVTVMDRDLGATLAARPPFTDEQRAAARAGGRIEGNIFGSLLGYPNFDEVVAILDEMHTLYPNLITAKTSLGQTIEGRDIWMVEISDNPGVDEEEGEVLYTALHHAREPQGPATVLYYMWYLLEQYATNSDVADLVDSRRMFFVPIVNPDGYVYNELLDSDGQYPGWRKNCRVNSEGGLCCTLSNLGACGVDLNRNYSYLWGYDDTGSSPNPGSGTYRGTAPFSEPETSAMRGFLESGRQVSETFNYHTYSNLLLYPWSYENGAYTPDNDLFQMQAEAMTEVNGYTYGTSWEILYRVNGGSDDWMYGEQTTKPKILAYTPEVGNTFWPDPSLIIPLADENLEANLLLAEYASVIVTGLVEDAREHPDGFVLGENYPNPFNPSTRIPFVLSESGEVVLTVFDVLGREVAVLVEGRLVAGSHAATFAADGLPSGVYVARLETAGQVQSRTMLLVK